jgi:hypothetical protein
MWIWFMDFIPGSSKIKGGCMTRQRGALESTVNDDTASKKGLTALWHCDSNGPKGDDYG